MDVLGGSPGSCLRWSSFPLLAHHPPARAWLTIQANLGLATTTLDAYGRAIEDFLRFASGRGLGPDRAARADIAAYARALATRPNPRGAAIRPLHARGGLANATLQQRLTKGESVRNRFATRQLWVRAETTRGRGRERMACYSASTNDLYREYQQERRTISRAPGRLFLSLLRRNRGQPLAVFAWTDVVERIAERVGLAHRFTTQTPRHLCLTHLARAGWDIHELATFAGHSSIQTTLLYVHLSGRELGPRYDRAMATIRAQIAGTPRETAH